MDVLDVLFEDNHCLAINKPAGLLTQGVPTGVPTLESAVRDYLKMKYHKLGNVYLGIPHRLDRPVSGVILFARSSKAAARLAEQFRERQVTKIYWALVERSETNDLPPEQGVWENWILKLPAEARSEIVAADVEGARAARLSFTRLQTFEDGALLELRPETGRMHQIRVQSASRGWPVRGDSLYGAKRSFGPPSEQPRDRLIALHARALTFLHPIRYEPITLTAPLSEHWQPWRSDSETVRKP